MNVDTTSPAPPWARTLRAEPGLAFATPAARLLLAGSVVMAVVTGSANVAVAGDLTTETARRLALHAATVPSLVFALLAGAYSASSDRRAGVVDQRLLSDTSRTRWLLGKCTAQAVVGLVYGTLGALTAIGTATTTFAIRGDSFDVASSIVGRALVGVVLACAMFAVLGAAVGALTTNTAAAVGGLLAWVLVVEPPALLGLPPVGRLLPASGALAFTLSPDTNLLAPALGGLVLFAYTVTITAFGVHRFRTLDV